MSKMKDSGIEWIGAIPEEWEVVPAKYLGMFSSNGVDKKQKEDEPLYKSVHYMDVYRNSLKEINNSDSYLVISASALKSTGCDLQEGDVLFTNSSETPDDIGHSTVVGENLENTLFGYHLMRFRPAFNYDLFYLKYLFGCYYLRKWFEYRAVGMTRYGLTRIDFTSMKLLLPSKEEQEKQSHYLDNKCTQIDAAIAAQRTEVEKLKEYKQAVITKAVTKGLDPDVPLKDSGVEWIGDIPIHWATSKNKFFITMLSSGVSVNSGSSPAERNELGVLKTSCVYGNVFNALENKEVNFDEYERVSCSVLKNTIIVSRMNTPQLVGACGYVSENYPNLFLPDRLWQVHYSDDVITKYYWYYLSCDNAQKYLGDIATGTSSSMKNISQGQFLNMPLVYPPLLEQIQIAEYLDHKCAQIDSAIFTRETLIERLDEYKKSLIYEVVTGKKEV